MFLKRRTMNFRRTFESEMGKRVLADLLAFCDDPRISSPNPFLMAQMVGRQQVRKHLMAVLAYSERDVQALLAEETEHRTREVA